jgi:ribosomal-protein-alanine N-acetyltransferase
MDANSVDTRWMRESDIPDVIRISSSCGDSFSEKNMRRLFFKKGIMSVVAEVEYKVVGLIIYDSSLVSKMKIVLVAVEEPFRRSGVGRALVSQLISKLDSRRNKLELLVSEYNLNAQLFFREMGFKAVSVEPGSPDHSEYRFLFRLSEIAEKSKSP